MKGQVKKESNMAETDTKSRPNRKVTEEEQGQLRRQQIQQLSALLGQRATGVTT